MNKEDIKKLESMMNVEELYQDLMRIPCLQGQQGHAYEIAEALSKLGYEKKMTATEGQAWIDEEVVDYYIAGKVDGRREMFVELVEFADTNKLLQHGFGLHSDFAGLGRLTEKGKTKVISSCVACQLCCMALAVKDSMPKV
jgi:hypothetical protein